MAISDGAEKANLIEAKGRDSWEIITDGTKILRLLSTFPEGVQVELLPKMTELVVIHGRGRYSISAREFSTSEVRTKFKETETEKIPKEVLDRLLKPEAEQKNSWGFSLQVPWPKK